MSAKAKKCELCAVDDEFITRHHLRPKISRKSKPKGPIAYLCEACHRQIHRLFTNHDLRVRLNTIPKLKRSGKVRKWLKWRKGKCK